MIDLDALEQAARAEDSEWPDDVNEVVLELIARLRAAEGALMAIHEFANDDGNWEHEEIIADDGMFIGCDGRYTVEAMASDALKGMSDAVPNV